METDPQSFGVGQQNTQGVGFGVQASVAPQAQSAVPPTPGAPPKQTLNMGEFEFQQARFSLRYLLISASITLVVASLVIAYLTTSNKTVAAQYSKKYDTEVASTLELANFKEKQKVVEDAGTSLSNLQTEINSRVKFSNFFTELSRYTYQKSRITRLTVLSDGNASMEGVVSSFSDLSKFTTTLQSSAQFTNINVLSAEKQTDGSVVFSVSYRVNSSLLRK